MTAPADSGFSLEAPRTLAARDVEAIAARVAELLDRPTHRLMTANEVADLLSVDVAYVYAHQRELGVLRLPSAGRRPALRFDRDVILARLRPPAEQPTPAPRRGRGRARRPSARAAVELLPYEPRSAA